MPLTRPASLRYAGRPLPVKDGERLRAAPFPKKPECPCLDCQTRSNSAVTILP
jgi:hypothetical protein